MIESCFSTHPHWPHVEFVCQTLMEADFQVLLAGGCVRDALLGRVPSDFDLATSATPDQVLGLFPRGVDIGKEFGVIMVPFRDFQIEVTTFRSDGDYADGRRPKKIQFSSPEEDAKRRDFTINAMFFDLKEQKVVDYFEGQQDLQAKIIRTVGDPETRFAEDHLRILRAVRFAAQLDFSIEEQTYQALTQLSSRIELVSGARVRQELEKMFLSPGILGGLLDLSETGLWDVLFEGLPRPTPEAKALLEKMPRNLFLIWSVLIGGFPPSREHWEKHCQILKKLTYGEKTLKPCLEIIENFEILQSQKTIHLSLLRALEGESGERLSQLFETFLSFHGNSDQKTFFGETCKKFDLLSDERGHLPEALLSGKDILDLGVKPGPQVRQWLDEVYFAQLQGQVKSRSEALCWLKPKI